MAASPRRRLNIDRRVGRWVIVLAITAAAGLLVWFGLRWERGETDMMAETAPAAGGDMVPPGDLVPPGDDDPAAPPAPDASGSTTTTDVIPPEEP